MQKYDINDKPIKVYALIVAAGKGNRFNNQTPKQYQVVANKFVIQHSVSKIAQSHYIHDCFLVIASNDKQAQQLSWDLPINYVIGGDERWQSVQSGVNAIWNMSDNSEDLVLIHDAARPCVDVNDINQVIEVCMYESVGAILGIPATDTLKKVNDAAVIEQTVNRANIWQAQTPQVFRLEKLKMMIDTISEKKLLITDEASGFEQLGYPIKVVEGSRTNIKLTYPEDLSLVEFLLLKDQ